MSFEAQVLNVLIASPGDTGGARDTVEAALLSWNRDNARSQRVVLLPLRWEVDAVPEFGGDAQSVINRQLVDESDIVIGLFHSRLGRPTSRGASGTVEEIERSLERGARVHVYFSEMPHPHDVDVEQLRLVNELRGQLQQRGLLGSYSSLDDLTAKVRTALERDVNALFDTHVSVTEAQQPRAVLRVRYAYDREPEMDSKGRTRMRTRRERLVIENLGSAAAEKVSITVDAVGEGTPPSLYGDTSFERVPPQSSVNVPAVVHMGVAPQWRVTIKWRENAQEHEEVLSVTPF